MERRSMSREIKIHLPENQCDALAAEAKAAGRSFFDHCRVKLLANTGTPVIQPTKLKAFVGQGETLQDHVPDAGTWDNDGGMGVEPAEGSRIDRLEAMMMQMADAINNLANPQHLVEAEPLGDVDVNDVINQSLEGVEMMPVEREQMPTQSMGVRPVGQRMVSRLHVGVPGHVAGLFPG